MNGLNETSDALARLSQIKGIPDKVFEALAGYVEMQCRQLTKYLDDSVVQKNPRLHLGPDRLVRLQQVLNAPKNTSREVAEALDQLAQTSNLALVRFDRWGVARVACEPGGVLNNMNWATHYMADLVIKGVMSDYRDFGGEAA